jgi:hypothetical protein
MGSEEQIATGTIAALERWRKYDRGYEGGLASEPIHDPADPEYVNGWFDGEADREQGESR